MAFISFHFFHFLDYNDNPAGHFAIVSNNIDGKTSDEFSISELKSPYFLSTEHPVECFSFYFIFGPDEIADELTVLIRKKDNR